MEPKLCTIANLCNDLALAGCSPEKAGVGDSIPFLTTVSGPPSGHALRSEAWRRAAAGPEATAALGCKLLGREAVDALAVGAFGGLNGSPHLLPECSAQKAAH